MPAGPDPTTADRSSLLRDLAICIALIVSTVVVYGQVTGFEFVHFDDDLYVFDNPNVSAGLTGDGVRWAFTTGAHGNWHPLVWLTLMLDAEIHGLEAGGFHATNLILHLLNALLLFHVLRRMTGTTWPGAFVAALFALHPLHVESVAWVTERKDVLSTLFGLLSMLGYVAWARDRSRWGYAAAWLCLALSLMSKPMLVTLPFVFLLLDYWPLRRFSFAGGAGQPSPCERRSMKWLLVEKVPFLLLVVGSSVVTQGVQGDGGAVAPLEALPMSARLANAAVSYATYLGKTVWPSDLCILYLHPNLPGGTGWSSLAVKGSTVLLILITILVLWSRRGYAIVGWLFYAGTLVPVAGFVQVGKQAMADRYTYVPLIGIFLLIAFAAAEFLERRKARAGLRRLAGVLAGSVLVACMVVSFLQVRHWRDSPSLFQHAIDVDPTNYSMHFNLGNHHRRQGRIDQAIQQYRTALTHFPMHSKSHFNLASALQHQGLLEEAVEHFRRAAMLRPGAEERAALEAAVRALQEQQGPRRGARRQRP